MQNYDIVFVGAGLSSSATLYHILDNLQKQHYSGAAKKIAVIEKNNEFWKGMPYGNRSSIHSLTINPIKDFFVDAEKPVFFTWMNHFRESHWEGTAAEDKEVLNHWVAKNADKLNETDFDSIYIPRFLYGIYLAGKLDNVIMACNAEGIAEVERIGGEAIDVEKIGDIYQIAIDTPEQSFIISADALILGTGSLDTRRISEGKEFGHLLIDDIYYPTLEVNLARLDDALAKLDTQKRNMLIIGSNASASEILHMLSKSIKTQKNNFNKIYVLSTSGLPDRLYVNNNYDNLMNNLKALEADNNYTADALMDAIRLDVENAAANHDLSVGKIHYSLSDRAVKIQQKLSPEESLKFFNNHGWSFTRITRRTSEDYYITEKELADAGKLDFIKGRFVKLTTDEHNPEGLGFIYKDSDASAEEKKHDTVFPIVINCIGAEHPSNTSSKLYANLLGKGILQINHNSMGLHADENFMANDNLYLIGPLLAGIYNNKFKFWHLENAKRLNGLAAILSKTITEKIG